MQIAFNSIDLPPERLVQAIAFRGVRAWTTIYLLCVMIPFGSLQAQSSSPPSTRTRPDPIQRELQRRFESEAIERILSGSSRRRGDSEWRAVLTQIRQDFLQIQVANDEIRRSSGSDVSLNLKLIEKSAAEIARCAQRLKSNLALPKTEKDFNARDSKTYNSAELRLSLTALDAVLNAFVANPVFERLGVVDARFSAQASRDLEQIIEISKLVKKSSEKLRRAKSA